ncbi:hypothetical protein BKA01_003049 [Pseudonocardia eucalypti]|nr:hypothetical protein [Pseudonocardia eucalypti]
MAAQRPASRLPGRGRLTGDRASLSGDRYLGPASASDLRGPFSMAQQ